MSAKDQNPTWQLGELLADPRKLFVLWSIDNRLFEDVEDFRTHFGVRFKVDQILDELRDLGFISRQDATVQLTDVGRAATARFRERPLDSETYTAIRSKVKAGNASKESEVFRRPRVGKKASSSKRSKTARNQRSIAMGSKYLDAIKKRHDERIRARRERLARQQGTGLGL